MNSTDSSHACLGPRFVGDPVDVVTGEVTDRSREFAILLDGITFVWERHYRSLYADEDRGHGLGHRHGLDWVVRRHLDGWSIEGPQVLVEFGMLAHDGAKQSRQGWTLTRQSPQLFQVKKAGDPTRIFSLPRPNLREARLERILHAAGDETVLGYEGSDEAPRLAWVRNSRGWGLHVIVHGNHIAAIRGTGRVEGVAFAQYEYDTLGQLVKGTNAYNHSFHWRYDRPGRVQRRIDRNGYGFVYDYDSQGRCTRVAGDDGMDATRLRYDPIERLTEVEYESNGALAKYHYAGNDDLTEIEYPLGGKRAFVYDAKTGALELETDRAGGLWRVRSDGSGAVVAKIDPLGYEHCATEDPCDPEFDPFEHKLPTAVALQEAGVGLKLGFEVPPLRQLGLGLDAELRSALLGVEYVGSSSEHRDVQGLLLREERTFGNGTKLTRHFTHDRNGNLIEIRDCGGGVWRLTVASWNLPIRAQDPLGHETHFSYTQRTRVARIVDPGQTVTEYEWDREDQLVEVRRHGKVRERYERSVGGHLIAKYDAEGNVLVSYERGPMGMLSARRSREGVEEIFKNDEWGRPVAIATTDAECRKHTVECAYDSHGRRLKDHRNGEGLEHIFWGEQLRQTTLSFAGRRHPLRIRYDQGAFKTLVIVDPSDQVHRIADIGPGLMERTFASGTVEVIQYDSEGHTVAKASRSSRGVWLRRFLRNGDQALTLRQDNRRGNTQYQYDAAHRLVATVAANGTREAFVHDAAGNLLAQPGLSEGQIVDDDGLGPSLLVAFGQTVAMQPGNRIYRANGDLFEYDAQDHILAREGITGRTRYIRDAIGRLRRIETVAPGSAETQIIWEAEYDGFGRRTCKRVHGKHGVEEWTFYWDSDRLAAEIMPDGRLRMYVYPAATGLVPMLALEYASVDADPKSARCFVLQADHRGAIERVEDETGNVVWDATIHPYGGATIHGGQDFHQPFRLVGQYFDPETGLCSQRFRYWSPELGRFMESDPLGLAGWSNVYAWPGCPLNTSDPFGLGKCPVCGGDTDDPNHQAHPTGPDAENAGSPTLVVETPAQKRARLQQQMADRRRSQRRVAEAAEHGDVVAQRRAQRDSGEFAHLDPADRALLADERGLARASDRDKGIGRSSGPGSAIDEARAMDHAETSGQLPGPVERSVRPGADVRTNAGTDNEQHWSMKGIVPQDLPGSRARAQKEMNNLAGERRRGGEPHGLLVDLRHSPNPAAERAAMQQHADQVNQQLIADGHDPIPVEFIEP